MICRYGKRLGDLSAFKLGLFTENESRLARSLTLAADYRKQALREKCKICGSPLPEKSDFAKHSVPYAFCATCGHLNGLHEDGDEYFSRLYTADGGKEYGSVYGAADAQAYRQRVDAIYAPKAKFLSETLASVGETPAALSYADLGAGSGYFVAALTSLDLQAVGHEISHAQTEFANAMLASCYPGGCVERIRSVELATLASSLADPVVSMIGVLEHVQDPRAVLAALRGNPAVRYLYLSLPLFSASVLIEAAFPDIAPRQLEGGHTHLFTSRSIAWMAEAYQLEKVGEWWFGQDVLDLFRSITLTLQRNPETASLAGALTEHMLPLMDSWQLEIDQARFCSEVHLLFRISR